MHSLLSWPAAACALLLVPGPVIPASAGAPDPVRTGSAALGDWRSDAPGVVRHITLADLPPPFASPSAGNAPDVVDRPAGALPHAPPGFRVELVAQGLRNPRSLRVAPNGDLFVAETGPGRVLLLRATGQPVPFAEGLHHPFGVAFYPPGPSPDWVYVAEQNSVVRYPYHNGDIAPRSPAETVVAQLATTEWGHTTRDIAFSPDGSRMYVSVGSGSNIAEEMAPRTPEAVAAWQRDHPLGAAWGTEANRADVLVFNPDGTGGHPFATGIRNCVGLAVQPGSGALWCSTNERDGLGDNLVPDYVTRVREGEFFGWPWWYMGNQEDPRHRGERPDLAGRVTTPDVLLQAHSASLGLAFYDGQAFPPGWRGAFAAEHGSWNRAKRTGYKVIRIVLDTHGNPTGEYQDFLTGFVLNDAAVWGRPVGVAMARDGSLFVSEDGNGTIWRVSYTGN